MQSDGNIVKGGSCGQNAIEPKLSMDWDKVRRDLRDIYKKWVYVFRRGWL